MGLIEASSNKSFWRGVDYYEHNKVLSWGKSEDGKYFEHPYLISYEYEYNGKRYYSENESIPEAYYQYLHDENISTIEIKAYKNFAMLKGKEY